MGTRDFTSIKFLLRRDRAAERDIQNPHKQALVGSRPQIGAFPSIWKCKIKKNKFFSLHELGRISFRNPPNSPSRPQIRPSQNAHDIPKSILAWRKEKFCSSRFVISDRPSPFNGLLKAIERERERGAKVFFLEGTK